MSNLAKSDIKQMKQPDEFAQQTRKLFDLIAENSRLFLILLGVLFSMGVGYSFYSSHHETVRAEANSALYKAKEGLKTPLATGANYETQYAASFKQLQTVATQFSGTPAATQALLTMGDLHQQNHGIEKAIPYYEKAAQTAKGGVIQALTLMSLASAYETTKNYDKAALTFEKANALGDHGIRGELLVSAARNHFLNNNKAQAIRLYDQIISQMPDTAYAKDALHQKNKIK